MAKSIDSVEEVILDDIRRLIIRWKKAQGCGCCANYDDLSTVEDEIGELFGFDKYEDGSGYYLWGMPGTYVPDRVKNSDN